MPGPARSRRPRGLLHFVAPLWAAAAAVVAAGGPPGGRGRLVRSEEKDHHAKAGDARVAVVESDGALVGGGHAAGSNVRDRAEEDLSDAEMLEEAEASTFMGRSKVRGLSAKECAKEGGRCFCHGLVGYGRGFTRVFERVSGVIACDHKSFTEESGTNESTCWCYKLSWCFKNNPDNKIMDRSHRRRVRTGCQGYGIYQRRRWCGFGPRNCRWGQWGSWSDCEGTCGGQGVQKRMRQTESQAENGGGCEGEPQGTQPCLMEPCHPEPREPSNATTTTTSPKPGSAQALLDCAGIRAGDRFIQLGHFRLSDVNGTFFSVARVNHSASIVYTNSGEVQSNPKADIDPKTTWGRKPGAVSGISFGDNYVQIGLWRLGDIDGFHFAITHFDGKTAQVLRHDGRVENGPRTDFNAWDLPEGGSAAHISLGKGFIEIGNWRLGNPDSQHLSISHVAGVTAWVVKCDGTYAGGDCKGPPGDYGTWTLPKLDCSATPTA